LCYDKYFFYLHLECGDIEQNPGPPLSNQISVCHLNVRSLSTAKLNAIKHQLATSFDIITLSETFLSEDSTQDLSIEGFHPIIRKDRDTHGGGVAAYISTNLIFNRHTQFEIPNLECLCIEIHSQNNKFLIGVCYRPLTHTVDFGKTSNTLWIILQIII